MCRYLQIFSYYFVCATQGKGPAYVYFNVSTSLLHTHTHFISSSSSDLSCPQPQITKIIQAGARVDSFLPFEVLQREGAGGRGTQE